MPAYNFNARFADLVETGTKCQTIRRTDRGAKRGATAYLYTGQRTKHCRNLGRGTITDVFKIEIGRNGCGEPYAEIIGYVGTRTHLVHGDLDSFAHADGFTDKEAMIEWFDRLYGLPFNGYLHLWSTSSNE